MQQNDKKLNSPGQIWLAPAEYWEAIEANFWWRDHASWVIVIDSMAVRDCGSIDCAVAHKASLIF